MTRESEIEATIKAFLERLEKPTEFTADTSLYDGGIGLDSLETAELSAVLEDEFGGDPYSQDEMPETVGDLMKFFAATA